MSTAEPDDHDDLYVRFAEIVAAGEGYPQAPGRLAVEDFDEYWLAGKALVAVALVFASNPARRLYERMGFEAVGRVPEAVDGEDAIVYWRRL